MSESNPPRVIREKAARLTEGRVACALVLDRAFSPDEVARFYRLPVRDEPLPIRFTIEDRVVRFECGREEETTWRCAFERLLSRLIDDMPRRPFHPGAGIRARAGMRKLHVG